MNRLLLIFAAAFCTTAASAQSLKEFDEFRKGIESDFFAQRDAMRSEFQQFRDSINKEYAQMLGRPWKKKEQQKPIAPPVEPKPVPIIPIDENKPKPTPVEVTPVKIIPTPPAPQPTPVVPIEETKPDPVVPIKEVTPEPIPTTAFSYLGLNLSVRTPKPKSLNVSTSEASVSKAWQTLSNGDFDNTLVDCLKIRKDHKLCDWAYMNMVSELASAYCASKNDAAVMFTWLLCQSGFQMRFGMGSSHITPLFSSQHLIYGHPYFVCDGLKYYPWDEPDTNFRIADVTFKGESPLSLSVPDEQRLGSATSTPRTITSTRYPKCSATMSVNTDLLKFYDSYPTSAIGSNILSRWALYAHTPLSSTTTSTLYPALRSAIAGCSKLEAAERLLNWMQTGLVYKLDDEVWGDDRAFFGEETLFYPYCDCEDRAILFSHLIRDLLGLDVALVYYPGHLATAVRFTEPVNGDAMIIDGERFIICDPTYIGAPVGRQMTNVDPSKAQAIKL